MTRVTRVEGRRSAGTRPARCESPVLSGRHTYLVGGVADAVLYDKFIAQAAPPGDEPAT